MNCVEFGCWVENDVKHGRALDGADALERAFEFCAIVNLYRRSAKPLGHRHEIRQVYERVPHIDALLFKFHVLSPICRVVEHKHREGQLCLHCSG